jgi:hypothetical protein
MHAAVERVRHELTVTCRRGDGQAGGDGRGLYAHHAMKQSHALSDIV